LIVSIVSPKKSILKAFEYPIGKTSKILPLKLNSPNSLTVWTLLYPVLIKKSVNLFKEYSVLLVKEMKFFL